MIADRTLDLKAGDAVWIATAMLHREHPDSEDFSVEQIVQKVRDEVLWDKDPTTIPTHVNQHCVGNRPPNQAKLRMLIQTGKKRRRLSCTRDIFDGSRDGRLVPERGDIPSHLWPLLEWHEHWCRQRQEESIVQDPLLALAGTASGFWPEDAVAWQQRLRSE